MKNLLNGKMEILRNDVEMFICNLLDNLTAVAEESDLLGIIDRKTSRCYCFAKESLTFKEEKSSKGLELHIIDKESQNKVTLNLNNESNLKDVSLGAMLLDNRFLLEYL